ncbi:hypothetical protein Tco_0043269, partial [Tanacetum coccineum]
MFLLVVGIEQHLFLLVVGIDQHLFLLENPHRNRDLGILDSGCSRSMTGNKEKLDDFVKIIGGLPKLEKAKSLENPHRNKHNYVACNKGKQHKASYKAITTVSTISAPLQLLHMDLFGPTSIRRIDHRGLEGITVMPEPHNKMGLLKERIEAARTMLADSKLPTMFWTEAVSTACYVLDRVMKALYGLHQAPRT